MKNKFKQFHQYQQRVQLYSIIEIESWVFRSDLLIMKRIFKQWWSSIPPISIKWTITSHLNWTHCTQRKTTTYGDGNPGPGLGQKEQSHLLPLLVTDFLGTFASSIVTTIHCPCYWRYCTVHIYVVIHFCDSVCSYRVEENLCRFFYRLLMYVLEIQLHVLRRKVVLPLICLTPPYFYQ
jgi:hypothetical protein